MKLAFAFTVAAVLALVSAQPASAASCSTWKATCMQRGGAQFAQDCASKFNACLASGCFTEGKKYGGATHCELTRK
jgi:hypothetical protein